MPLVGPLGSSPFLCASDHHRRQVVRSAERQDSSAPPGLPYHVYIARPVHRAHPATQHTSGLRRRARLPSTPLSAGPGAGHTAGTTRAHGPPAAGCHESPSTGPASCSTVGRSETTGHKGMVLEPVSSAYRAEVFGFQHVDKIGVVKPHASSPPHHYVILPPCLLPGLVLWGLITRQSMFFFFVLQLFYQTFGNERFSTTGFFGLLLPPGKRWGLRHLGAFHRGYLFASESLIRRQSSAAT